MKRILILSDDEDVWRALLEHLYESGAEVSVAHDLRAGLDLLVTRPPDLAVVSASLGEEDGLDLLVEARRIGAGTAFVVIGESPEDGLARAFELGARYYFSKPIPAAFVAQRALDLCTPKHWTPTEKVG